MISLTKFKTFLLGVVLALTFPLKAHDLDILNGVYRSQINNASALSAYEVEVVWTLGQTGKDRLEELRREYKASCQHISRGQYRCQRFIDRVLPDTISKRIAETYSQAHLKMEAESLVELLFKGEEVEEYLVTQIGMMTTNHKSEEFSSWRYFFGRSELEKIQAGEKNPSPYSFVREGNTLNLTLSQSLTFDRFRFQVWIISLPFSKEQ